jgi:hypothetical protein
MRPGRWHLWLLLVVLVGSFGGGVAAFAARQAKSPEPLVLVEVRQVASAGGDKALAVAGSGFTGDLRALLSPLPWGLDLGTESALPMSFFSLDAFGEAPLAVTGRNARLLLIDWREGASAEVLGSASPPENLRPKLPETGVLARLSVQSLARLGTNIVITLKNAAGVLLYDISDPRLPRLIDQIDTASTVYEMLAHRGRIYATDRTGGLKLIDIVGGRLSIRGVPGPAGSWRLAADGRSLVVASRSGKLTLYALEQDGWPRLVGRLAVGAELRDLTLSSTALHVCTADGWLHAYDISRWPSVRLAGKVMLPWRPLQIEAAPSDPWLFVSLMGLGVVRIDVTQPLAPKLAGLLHLDRMPIDFAVAGRRLLMVGQHGLERVSLEQWPAAGQGNFAGSPLPSTLPYLPRNGEGVAYDGTGLAALPDIGAVARNFTNPPMLALPDKTGIRLYRLEEGFPKKGEFTWHPLPHSAENVLPFENRPSKRLFWKGRSLFVLGIHCLWIMDCDSSGRLTPVGQYDFAEGAEAQAMALVDPDHVAVACGRQGLVIVDISDPATPRQAGGYPVPTYLHGVGNINDVLYDGARLFASRLRLGVEIFDVSEPRNPVPVQLLDTPGAASHLALQNDLLLVADGHKGGQVIDMRGPAPQLVASLSLPRNTSDIVLSEHELFALTTLGLVQRQPLPRRLAFIGEGSRDAIRLSLPAETPPGQYTLTFYGGGRLASLPVTLR